MWIPSCTKLLIINALQFQIPFHHLFATCLSLPSPSKSSYFTNLYSGLTMDLPIGLSFYFKLHFTFTVMMPLSVSTCCFCIWIFLILSSRWLLSHRYHWPIRGLTVSVLVDLIADIHVISTTDGIHHFIAIPLNGSFYLQPWLDMDRVQPKTPHFSMVKSICSARDSGLGSLGDQG